MLGEAKDAAQCPVTHGMAAPPQMSTVAALRSPVLELGLERTGRISNMEKMVRRQGRGGQPHLRKSLQ